mmetsp:Transcript_25712/g.45108  ORF Transcript_25712/g.45108 Transcript_25712/m.45108 type:complete len:119 (-) Transcript_25712:515-871(-)
MAKGWVLYDGDCNLCLSSVDFVRRHSEPGTFVFTPFQDLDDAVFKDFPSIPRDMSSMAYIEQGKVYLKSTAMLTLAWHLSIPYNSLYLLKVTPWFVRDYVYDYIGRHRYKWFGRRSSN